MTFLVTCGICGDSIRLRSTRDVYGDDDPFLTPLPHTESEKTVWHPYNDAYFCGPCTPIAAARVSAWNDAARRERAEAMRRLEHEMDAWTVKNPYPTFNTTIEVVPEPEERS